MALSLSEELRRSFHLASLRREMKLLKTGRQRQAARTVMDRCENLRQRETRQFRARYDMRVELARRRLIHEAGAVNRDFSHPFAAHDRFNASDTLRQARRMVRAAHDQRLARIDRIETRALETLMRRSMRQNNLRGKVREAFKPASDRRSGPKRNGPSR